MSEKTTRDGSVRCAAWIDVPGTVGRKAQCTRKGVCGPDFKGEWHCRQHDTATLLKKRAKR